MTNLKVNFKVKYIVIILILIIVIGLLAGILSGLVGVGGGITGDVSGCVAIMALIYHALSLESQYKFHQENLFLSKNQEIKKASQMIDPHMTEALQFLSKIDSEKDKYFPDKKVQKFLDYIKENPIDRQKIVIVMNYFELLSILIVNGHVEEKIIKNTFKTVFISTFILLRPYIDHRQLEKATVWCNFQLISKKWNE